MTRAEREAFRAFIEYIKVAMPSFDGCVPVALICMPVKTVHADGGIDIHVEGTARLLWPADFPEDERAKLLASLVKGYSSPDFRRIKGSLPDE